MLCWPEARLTQLIWHVQPHPICAFAHTLLSSDLLCLSATFFLGMRLAGKTSQPDLPYQQQLAVGRKVASHFSGMLPALGICEASQAVIEARFAWQLAVLQQHLQQLPYLLSSNGPCIADFGLMGPLYAREWIAERRCAALHA
jgi:hypothetical protein